MVPPLRRGTWIPAFAGMTDETAGVVNKTAGMAKTLGYGLMRGAEEIVHVR